MADAADRARVTVRRAEGRIVDLLFAYTLDRFGKAFFEHAWADFWGAFDPPEARDFVDIPEFAAMFVPWLVTSFVRDPHDDAFQPHWPDEPMALHWLKAEQPVVSDIEREWIKAACASPLSALAIEDVQPGTSIDLRDMLTGRRFHVLEQGASRTLKPGDVHFARVVTAGGISVMFGGAPYSLPPDRQIDIVNWRQGLPGKRTFSRKDLEEFDIEIRDLYLQFAEDIRNPKVPELRNTDGDPIEMTTLVFTLSTTAHDAFERLKPLALLDDEDHIDDVATGAEGEVTAAALNWVKAGNRQHRNWSNTILGHLKIERGRLTVEVNSARRADRITKEILKRLRGLAALERRSTEDISEHLRAGMQPRGAGERDDTRDAASEPPRPAELVAMEAELYRQHAEAWIDMRVPALGNKTPRQAARTKDGREKVEALLAGFGDGGTQDPRLARETIDGIRTKLGLAP